MSLYGQQIGRQPFRPGQWSRYQGHSHKTYVQNNFYGSVWGSGYGNYGNYYNNDYYGDTGMSKGAKWMLGLGGAATLLGTVLGFLGIGKGASKEPANVEEEEQQTDSRETGRREQTERLDSGRIDGLDVGNRPPIDPVFNPGAEEIKEVNDTNKFTFNVRSDLQNMQADSKYNIVAGLYRKENGEKLSHDETMDLVHHIFGKNVSLKVGDLDLKDETVNGVKYVIKENPSQNDVTMDKLVIKEDNLTFYENKPSSAQDSSSKWYPTIDGKRLGKETYATKEEAEQAAKQKADALRAEHQAAAQSKEK